MEILKVKNLNFYYGEKHILENICFSLKKGDYLAIIGPNGAGKSVLIKNIVGLLKPSSGKIKLFGKNMENFSKWHKIGYVPQKATNFEQNFPATVDEIVSMGIISRKRFPKFLTSKDRNDVKKYLEVVGMADYKDSKIGQLSGGQQQRVFIARALISGPSLLILDEPTVGIDKKSQQNFYDLLNELNEEGITIIMITHDLTYITKYVNKVACLNRRMLFHGTHDEFCSAGNIEGILGKDKHIILHDHDI